MDVANLTPKDLTLLSAVDISLLPELEKTTSLCDLRPNPPPANIPDPSTTAHVSLVQRLSSGSTDV